MIEVVTEMSLRAAKKRPIPHLSWGVLAFVFTPDIFRDGERRKQTMKARGVLSPRLVATKMSYLNPMPKATYPETYMDPLVLSPQLHSHIVLLWHDVSENRW